MKTITSAQQPRASGNPESTSWAPLRDDAIDDGLRGGAVLQTDNAGADAPVPARDLILQTRGCSDFAGQLAGDLSSSARR